MGRALAFYGPAPATVSYGYRRAPVEELGADIIVDNFADIPEALARLNGAVG